jgi:hypothetical protein
MLDRFLAAIRSEPHCGFITTQSLNRPLEVPEGTRQLRSITILKISSSLVLIFLF